MTFAERLLAGQFPLSLEITPPRVPKPAVLRRRAALLGDLPDAINVIQRPGRQSSLEASLELLADGRDPVWHLTVRGRTVEGIAADCERGHEHGIRQVLCVRGDASGGGEGGPRVREAIELASRAMPGVLLGATLNQHVSARERALGNLLGKIRAGARYVQTQPVFDISLVSAMVERLRESAPEVRVVPMVMPITTLEHAGAIATRLGIEIPDSYRVRLRAGEDGGWAAFRDTVQQLNSARSLFDGLAVMTFEADPPPRTGARILAALAQAGLADRAAPARRAPDLPS